MLLFHLRGLGNSTVSGNCLRINPLDLIFSWLSRKSLLVKAVKVGVQQCSLSREPLAVRNTNTQIRKYRNIELWDKV